MPNIHLPAPGRPLVVIERTAERGLLDIDPAAIVPLYKAHGALLLRGFGLEIGAFGRFARQFCTTSVVNESPGRRAIAPDDAIYTVDGGTGAFSLHPELSREPWKPDAAFFACFAAPRAGGATTICDGVALAAALPDAVREGLADRRLLYIKPCWPELLAHWLGTPDPDDALLAAPPPACPYSFARDADGAVLRIFSRPALHRPMFGQAPAFGNFLLFARFNNNRRDFPVLDDGRPVPEEWLQAIRATADRLAVGVAWAPGDVLMLDNTRFMHGRTAIHDPGERRIATFFGYLGFALPNPEEPPDPVWRQRDFCPPPPPR